MDGAPDCKEPYLMRDSVASHVLILIPRHRRRRDDFHCHPTSLEHTTHPNLSAVAVITAGVKLDTMHLDSHPAECDGAAIQDRPSKPSVLPASMTADEFEDFLDSGNCTLENLGWTHQDYLRVLSLPPMPPGTGMQVWEPSTDHDPNGNPNFSFPNPQVSRLEHASSMGDMTEVKAIIQDWEQTPTADRTPKSCFDNCLRSAIDGHHLSIVHHLMAWGIPVEEFRWESDFKRAMDLSSYAVLQLFLDHGFDINHETSLAPFSTTLISRTYYLFHAIEMTRWFLDHGADPNRQSRNWAESNTPLSWAVLHASLDTIKLLFDRGGPDSIKHGYLLYHAALRKASHRVEVIEYLLTKGGLADINKLEYHDNPILASERNHYFVCNAPIHVAASDGDLEVLQLLVSRGADPLLPNAKGQLAIELARQEARQEIVDFLSQFKARTKL
ncbi:MAG: hypothetical protein L6R40_001955 [Gallowayella cf. fulva]|nr:MAG: hypothetical protein L6R40_001955 [Xanthomendoza cf. fulva]